MVILFILFGLSVTSFFVGISYSDMIFERCLSQSSELWQEQPAKPLRFAFNISGR